MTFFTVALTLDNTYSENYSSDKIEEVGISKNP